MEYIIFVDGSFLEKANFASCAILIFNNNKLVDEDAFIYARKAGGGEDRTKVIGYGGANKTNVIVPDGVLEIGASAFAYCYI